MGADNPHHHWFLTYCSHRPGFTIRIPTRHRPASSKPPGTRSAGPMLLTLMGLPPLRSLQKIPPPLMAPSSTMPSTTSLNLRLDPELHARIKAQADREGSSLNRWITKRLTAVVDNTEPAALDQRDSMEALAQAIQDTRQRLERLERLARQSGADL